MQSTTTAISNLQAVKSFLTTLTPAQHEHLAPSPSLTAAGGNNTICYQNDSSCGFSVGQITGAKMLGAVSLSIAPTLDLLVGGTSTATAKFAVRTMPAAYPLLLSLQERTIPPI